MTIYNGIKSGQCFRLTDEDTAAFLSGGHVSCSTLVWEKTRVPLHAVSSTPKIKVFSAISPYSEYSRLIIDVDSKMGYFENSGNHESDIIITQQKISYTGLPYITSDIPDLPSHELDTVTAHAVFSENVPWFRELILECLKMIVGVPESNELVCLVPCTKERRDAIRAYMTEARDMDSDTIPIVHEIHCTYTTSRTKWTLYRAFISEYVQKFTTSGKEFLLITLTGTPVRR